MIISPAWLQTERSQLGKQTQVLGSRVRLLLGWRAGGERGEWGAFRMRFTVGCLSPLRQAWGCRRNRWRSYGGRVAVPGCGTLWDALERRGCREGGCTLCGGPQQRRGRCVPAWKGAFLPLYTQADAYPTEAVKQGRAAARLADSCPVICQPQGDARAGRLQLTSHFHLRNKR